MRIDAMGGRLSEEMHGVTSLKTTYSVTASAGRAWAERSVSSSTLFELSLYNIGTSHEGEAWREGCIFTVVWEYGIL